LLIFIKKHFIQLNTAIEEMLRAKTKLHDSNINRENWFKPAYAGKG